MHLKNLIIPENYSSLLNLVETESAIKAIKDFFQSSFSSALGLERVTAPLFVPSGTGINDDLNGIERPVSFTVKGADNIDVEIVQSLAKWKRMALADYGFRYPQGIYTDMNAIRPEENLDNLHSIYVDQWDWEKIMLPQERNLDFLKDAVKRIYKSIKDTEEHICGIYPHLDPILPDEIFFIHSEELLEMYPGSPPSIREKKIAEKHKAVFIIGIGARLSDGRPHDGRAPDYDDWISVSCDKGYKGLNGDILIYYPLLDCAFELSSMGIRVNKDSLIRQLDECRTANKLELMFHKRLYNDELPLSIGGGLGQSRMCMVFLRKAHIGEIQAGIWPEDMKNKCRENNIMLL